MYQLQISLFILLYTLFNSVQATDWFKNPDQQAQAAFERQEYETSAQLFTDPYQRGVALYRKGQYAEAIDAFTSVTRPETKSKAQYNLGNAYFQQGDYQKAITAYEQVLAEHPTDEDAKHNLALAKQLLESQKQEQQQNPSKNKQDTEQQQDSSENKQDTEQQQGEQSSQSDAQKHTDGAETTQKPNETQSSEQQPTKESQDKQPVQENNDSTDIAKPQPIEGKTTPTTASSEALPNEEEVMADVLLNRLEENPQRLLRNQFYLDAQRAEVPPPTQPW